MKKSFLLILSFFALQQTVFGQESDTTYWTNSLNFGLNFTQASFSDNWAGGGVNSIALGSIVQGKANYKKGKSSFDNEMELQYGLVNNEGQGFRKSADRILIDSKYGHSIAEKWNLFASANFLSQFDKGYKYVEDAAGDEQELLISKFMSPGFLTFALGFEYTPNDYFKLRLSPIAPRFTFVTDTTIYRNFPSNYGVEIGKKSRTEIAAANILATFEKDIAENLNLAWRYQLYANYEEFAFDTMDHRLDITLAAQVNKFINVNISAIALYDKDQDDDVQFSQTLAFGLQYSLSN